MQGTTMSLFGDTKIEASETPEKPTEVRLGKRSVRVFTHKKRREACARLMEILQKLEGKDIYIGTYDAGGRHFWLESLLLRRLQLSWHPSGKLDPTFVPGVIVLWGAKGSSVRIFTDYIVAVREQEYQGYWLYLLDFRTGFWQNPTDNYRSHYACLHIARFKDQPVEKQRVSRGSIVSSVSRVSKVYPLSPGRGY